LLDDVLSALDGSTEQLIIDRLLANGTGLFRKMNTTVILAGHAWRPMPLADTILVLNEDGTTKACGKWEDLRQSGVLNEDFIKSTLSKNQPQASEDGTRNEKKLSKPLEKIINGPSENDIADLNRQTGDIALYGYYARTIGWKISLGFSTAVAINSLATFFPRKLFFYFLPSY
jgi:ATP-binding cassette, subfamily C (CFTR/MRP), member 1